MAMIQTKLQQKIQLTHVVVEIFIAVFATLVFFPLSKITQHFNQNCLLNSDIWLERHSNHSVSLDLAKTVFGEDDECDYTTFLNVVVFLHSLIWISFFFHIDTLRCHNGSTINLLLPALITHIVMLICCVISTIKIGTGFSNWCDKIEANGRTVGFTKSCEGYESLSWTENRSQFYTYTVIALIAAWLLVVCLVLSILVTSFYLYWDFMATAFKPMDKSPSQEIVETSGFVDDGVGVVNKGAMDPSKEKLLKDDDDDDSSDSGDDEVVHDNDADGGDNTSGNRDAASLDQVIVDVHNQDPANQDGGSSGLRNRGSGTGVE